MLRLDYELLPADIDAFKCHVANRPALRRAMTQRYLLLLLCLPVLVMLFAWVMGGFRRLEPDPGALLTALLPSLLGLCLLPFFGRMRRASARSSTAFQLAGPGEHGDDGPDDDGDPAGRHRGDGDRRAQPVLLERDRWCRADARTRLHPDRGRNTPTSCRSAALTRHPWRRCSRPSPTPSLIVTRKGWRL
jgi:hypothetical protein